LGYSPLSWLHVATAVAAMAAGLGIVLMRKGTRVHRRVGYFYVVSMVALNVSSFFIFSLTGRFSPFHVASMFSLTILVAGFLPVFLRRPQGGWLRLHMEFMVWSYIGLLAAAVSEAAVRIPQTPFWWSVAGGTAVVIVTGALIWAHNRPRLLAQFMRRPG
jgi:uncharacterized membrane protein